MKKLFLFLTFFLYLCFNCYALSPVQLGVTAQGTTEDYSDILLWWQCESTDLDADDGYSGGTDQTATNVDDFTQNADAQLSGTTNGCDCPPGDTTADYATISIDGTDYWDDTNGGIIAFEFYINTWVNYQRLFQVDGDFVLNIYLGAGDEIRVNGQDAASNLDTSDANLSTGTEYILVYWTDPTLEDRKLHIYDTSCSEQGSGAEDLTTAITPLANLVQLAVGALASSDSTLDYYMDKVVIFDHSQSRSPSDVCAILKDNTGYPGN